MTNENNINHVIAADPPYPGHLLAIGIQGSEVARMQNYLNQIGIPTNPSIPKLKVDGIYGSAMRNAVIAFQTTKNLTRDGIIGNNTWDAIVNEYNTLYHGSEKTWIGMPLRPGSHGSDVKFMQKLCNDINAYYGILSNQKTDGIYGSDMQNIVQLFQRQFGNAVDGVIGQNTWNRIIEVDNSITSGNPDLITTSYPGTVMQTGSKGDSVKLIQSYLNEIRKSYNYNWPQLNADGKFGRATTDAVKAFQMQYQQKVDGKVGADTWNWLVSVYNAHLIN